MYMDRQLTCSTGQSIAAAAGTVVSTDKIDLANSGRDISRHNELRCYAVLGAAVTSGGAATVNVQYVESDNADLSAPDVLLQSGVTALANLTAGAVLMDTPAPATRKRYQGFQYVIAPTTTTGGTITSGLVKNTETAINRRPTGNTGLA